MNKSACDFPNVLAWSLISGITCTLERASLMEWPAVLKVSVTGKQPGTFFFNSSNMLTETLISVRNVSPATKYL